MPCLVHNFTILGSHVFCTYCGEVKGAAKPKREKAKPEPEPELPFYDEQPARNPQGEAEAELLEFIKQTAGVDEAPHRNRVVDDLGDDSLGTGLGL